MRALISVSDKTGITEFAKELSDLGIEIISTGGTAKKLRDEGIPVIDISYVTGFPEMMGGRVKTLHPVIHGAILADRDIPEHLDEMEKNGIIPIDIVVVNFYPFEKTVSNEQVDLSVAIENIDIGGPALVRAAGKNYRNVAIITDPQDYNIIISELKAGGISPQTRERLAVSAFRHVADYDCAIDVFLSRRLGGEDILRLKFIGGKTLRYGENWHQTAKLFRQEGVGEPNIAYARQLHGKEMSYNNYVDADSALVIVSGLGALNSPAITVSVVKHNNPCGLATGATLHGALEAAWSGDPLSAFGSIICTNSKVDIASAGFLRDKFVELIIAPEYDEDALSFLREKSKNLRIIKLPDAGGGKVGYVYKYIIGGMLEQSRDMESHSKWDVVTRHPFPAGKRKLAEFAWVACKYTRSNAVIIAYEYEKGYYRILGMGAGQPNRIDSLRKLALTKAMENLQIMYRAENPGMDEQEYIRGILGECVMASDAFFPFDDSVVHAAQNNLKYIVSTGGSIRDKEVINTANRLGVSLVFTGTRHFLH